MSFSILCHFFSWGQLLKMQIRGRPSFRSCVRACVCVWGGGGGGRGEGCEKG